MEQLKFSKDIWHYRVAKMGGLGDVIHTDVCSYTRRFMLGLLVIILLTTLVCVVTTPIIVVFAHLFTNVINVDFLQVCEIVCSSYALVLVGFGLVLGIRKLINIAREKSRQAIYAAIANGTYVPPKPRKKKEAPKASFLKLAYKHWKQKYCVRIQIS